MGTSVILVPFVLLLFPDGRLPSPRWRFPVWAYVLTIAVILVLLWKAYYEDAVQIEQSRFIECAVSGRFSERLMKKSSCSTNACFILVVHSGDQGARAS